MEDDIVFPSATVLKKKKWNNIAEFILTCLSMSVGLGNFWRFPYVSYTHGGGAFLLPYIVVLLIIGRPMYYLDLSLGQFSGKGSIGLYHKLAPGWLGLGVSQLFCCIAAFSYYAHTLAIVLWYFSHSFTTTLPWTRCQEEWGESCISLEASAANKSAIAMSSSEYYLQKTVLLAADEIESGLGTPDPRLVICLFMVWLVAFCYVLFGVRSTGKFAYFTGLFPYVILMVLLVRSCLNHGATDGLIYFFKPTWSGILTPKVWLAAASQLFFSLGIGYGTIAMYASYNEFDCNIVLVAYILAISDTCTSLLCGMTIFSAIGNLAHRLDVTIEDVIKGDGMSLGFVSYPDAISRFEQVPYLFAIIFFLMFFTLGIGSLCSFQQVLTTNMLELGLFFKEWHVAAITSVFGFASGIIYTTPGGQAVVKLVDLYGNVYLLMVNAICSVVAVFYVYGLQKWCWDLECMHKKPSSKYWRFSVSIVTFIAMVTIYICGCFQDGWLKYNNKPVPKTMMVSGYILLAIGSSPIPISILYYWIKFYGEGLTPYEALKKTFGSERWLPSENERIEQVEKFREEKLAKYPLGGNNSGKQFFAALVKNY